SHSPHPAEKAKWPCPYSSDWSQLQPLAPGDEIIAGSEALLIASVTDIGGGNFEFEVRRGFQRSPLSLASRCSAYAVPLSAQCSTSNYCTPGVGFWYNGSPSPPRNMRRDRPSAPLTWYLDPGAFAGHA